MNLGKEIKTNIANIKQNLPIETSFDVIGREILIDGRGAYVVFMDGFAKDDIMLYLLRDLQNIHTTIGTDDLDTFVKKHISYIEVNPFTAIADMQLAVLSGAVALVIDGFDTGIIIDARQYPARGPQESDVEKVTGGSKDGLVETIIFNTALIRRRVRDPQLTFEMTTVGERSKTDVAIGYIGDLVDDHLLAHIKESLANIKIPALTMAEKSLEELLLKKHWYNPLPQVRFTERPDVVAAHLMEGHIIIIVDTSPSVMIIPTTIFYFTQYAVDYNQNPLVGTFIRCTRFLAILIALLLTSTWLLLAEHSQYLPEVFKVIGAKEPTSFPLFVQLLGLEMGVHLLILSSLHTPNPLGSSFGILGGLFLGDLAIKVGFLTSETIFYTAVTAVATFCIPNLEFSNAIRVFRLFLLICTGLFGVYGYIGALVIMIVITVTTETFDKRRKYTWPLFPLDWAALKNVLIRRPILDIKRKNGQR